MNKKELNRGFTLVELIVVMGILGILVTVGITLLNPIQQIDKARDAKKQSDLEQIKAAMDLYYDDNGCYPDPKQFTLYRSSWSSDKGTVYMAQVPSSSDTPYVYMSDTTTACPQWYTIWAKLSQIFTSGGSTSRSICPLSLLADPPCHPQDDSGNQICVVGGTVSCPSISSQNIGD